jgi:hypothetical protein
MQAEQQASELLAAYIYVYMYICIYAGGAAREQATLGVYICMYIYMQAEQQASKLLSA